MCRLLGIIGQVDDWRQIAVAFSGLAEYGQIPPIRTEPGHKDGWGIAASNADRSAMVTIARQLGSAHESKAFRDAVQAQERQPHVFLGHVRKASPGIPITMGNVHPFARNRWAFIHNGTVYNPEQLPREPSFELLSDGSDSELLFGFILGVLSEAKDNGNRLQALADALISLRISHSSLNCIFSNGRETFAIRDYQQFGDYLTLYYNRLPHGVVICSEPLDRPSLNQRNWQTLPNRTILRASGSSARIELITY